MKRTILLSALLVFGLSIMLAYAAKPEPQAPTIPAIQGATRAHGAVDNPVIGAENVLVSLTGPGVFVSARLLAWGSPTPDDTEGTTVRLLIDGEVVVQELFFDLREDGLYTVGNNPFGITFLNGSRSYSLLIGFPQPLYFASSLVLSATVTTPADKLVGTVIYGE